MDLQEHPQFAAALAALDAGDVAELSRLLDAHPNLVTARTQLAPPYGYFTAATLLHHVAWNPSRAAPVPPDIAAVARLLLDRGAEVDALTLGPNGGTAMDLVLTSRMASEANVSGSLIDALRERGAAVALDAKTLRLALANHGERAAERLIELGAVVDLCAAAALGRLDVVRTHTGASRDEIGLAALFAYVRGKREVVEHLLTLDGNWDMTGVNNGTLLHRAAWDGDLATVQRLVALGADTSNRDNPFGATPLSWAEHNQQTAVVDWLRAHTNR